MKLVYTSRPTPPPPPKKKPPKKKKEKEKKANKFITFSISFDKKDFRFKIKH